MCPSNIMHNEEGERSTHGDRVLFSSVGLWEGFLGVSTMKLQLPQAKQVSQH